MILMRINTSLLPPIHLHPLKMFQYITQLPSCTYSYVSDGRSMCQRGEGRLTSLNYQSESVEEGRRGGTSPWSCGSDPSRYTW